MFKITNREDKKVLPCFNYSEMFITESSGLYELLKVKEKHVFASCNLTVTSTRFFFSRAYSFTENLKAQLLASVSSQAWSLWMLSKTRSNLHQVLQTIGSTAATFVVSRLPEPVD